MTFPRERNGYVDDGSLLRASNRRDKCPNCGSSNYRETVSREECKSCGLVCDYWGEGVNDVYREYEARQLYADQCAAEEREREHQRSLDAEPEDDRW